MDIEFNVEKEAHLLAELARVHDDQDSGSRISPQDLQFAPQKLLGQLRVDDPLEGSLEEKAQVLSNYFEEIRFADFLIIKEGILSGQRLSFFRDGWEPSGEPPRVPLPVREFVETHREIRTLLERRYPQRGGAQPAYYLPPQPAWKKGLHQGRTVRMTQPVYEELRSSYDCKNEQIYLLLAHKKTGVIERVLRPRYREMDHGCGFEEHWVDYVAGVLRATNAPYVIVGTYHSHPGLKSAGFAGYEPSSDDGGAAGPYSGLEIIGHAETLECGSDQFSKTFRINPYAPGPRGGLQRVRLQVVPSTNTPVFLDEVLSQSTPFHRGKESFEIDRSAAASLMERLGDTDSENRLQREGRETIGQADRFSLEVVSYYDGSYSLSLVLRKQDDLLGHFGFSYSPNMSWSGGRGDYVGRVDFDFVLNNCGSALSNTNELRLLEGLRDLFQSKIR